MKIVPFNKLSQTDLIVDAIYEGGSAGNAGDDPISKLIPGIGNMAGFRYSGRGNRKKFIVLYTSREDKDWPDTFDLNTGMFTYYGDNRTPGHELHDTPRKGNLILRQIFMDLHSEDPNEYKLIPPIFIFTKYPTENSSRSVQFRGVAVPGFSGLSSANDLVAVWKSTKGQRFQNYKAIFTMLDIAVVSRKWIDDITLNRFLTNNTPKVWRSWESSKTYIPLISESTTSIRSIEEQTPKSKNDIEILETVYEYFKDHPISFEAFAARVYSLHDSRVIIDEITRGSVDGGRDALGRYRLGLDDDPIYVDFSLEAKCYRPGIDGDKANTVGVKEVSRLISRLLHRQFGILVTTSVVARQAYLEVREDRHPIVFISGKDIVDILVKNGFNTPEIVKILLENEYNLPEKT